MYRRNNGSEAIRQKLSRCGSSKALVQHTTQTIDVAPLVHLGVHPCFVGPHSEFVRGAGVPKLHPGYRSSGRYETGPGISPDELQHIRKRFFRGRHKSASGSGLGLAIADAAMRKAGGKLRFRNRPEGGLVAEILLPLGQPAS